MKNNDAMAKIKREDKKPKRIFILMLVCGFVIGILGGMGSEWLKDSVSINNMSEILVKGINDMSVFLPLVTGSIATIVVTTLYKKSRKDYEQWNEEDDEAIEKIEQKLALAMVIANGNLIFAYIFAVIGTAHLSDIFASKYLVGLRVGSHFVGFVLCIALAIVAGSKIVNFEKEINPEKKGSFYDFNFEKKWLASSDEAEKLVTYKSAYAAYKSVNVTCLLLWLFCMVGMEVWEWDSVPVFMVGIIWLTSYISYSVEALKLSKNTARIQE